MIVLAPLLGPSACDNNPNQGSTETTADKDEANEAFSEADDTNENDREDCLEGHLEGGNDNGDRDGWVGWRGRGWQRLELTAACLGRGTGVGRQDARPLPIMVVKGAETVPSFLVPRLDDVMAAAVGEGLFDCCDGNDASTTTTGSCTSCAHGHITNNIHHTHHTHRNGHPNQQHDVDVDDADDDNNNDLAKAMTAPVCDKYRAAAILRRLVDDRVSALFAAGRWFDARFYVCMRHWILRALPDMPEEEKEDEDHVVSDDDKGSKGGINGSGGGSGRTATTRSKKTVAKTVKPIHPMHE